ncbi:MAG: peptidoglycan DD-metalloendopeptidase family protein [Chitinophagales bacterium]|nr:peptidoglycan DD-metalloendopeptidase family protein [Chitinophagales bacterium]
MRPKIKITLLTISIITLGIISSAFKLFNHQESGYRPLVNQVCQNKSFLFDIRIDTLSQKVYYPKKGESFKTVLLKNGVSSRKIEPLRRASRQYLNINNSVSGLPTTLLKDSHGELKYVILEKKLNDYFILDIEAVYSKIEKKEIVVANREVVGIIRGDLYTTFKDLDVPRNLIYQIDKVYDYTFNLYKLRNGDTIRLQYEEQLVDGIAKSATQLNACVLSNKGKRYYAIYYKTPGESKGDYYDENGNALKRSFLEKPLKYGRVSSKFSKNRFHPVLKVAKAHLGTDFAAPHGTPIIATADGVIMEASSSKYNGNYVKIKHNNMYTTQYLHMSRFAKGMKRGKSVKQGDVIGYVGSTGLATGPHVCYRFWKNGTQVDPFKENLRFAKAMDSRIKSGYLKQVKSIDQKLNQIKPLNHSNIFKTAVASTSSAD